VAVLGRALFKGEGVMSWFSEVDAATFAAAVAAHA
jgi:hypothetical protein